MKLSYSDLDKRLHSAVKAQKDKNNKMSIYKEYNSLSSQNTAIADLNRENDSLIISTRHAMDIERQAGLTIEELDSQNKVLQVTERSNKECQRQSVQNVQQAGHF